MAADAARRHRYFGELPGLLAALPDTASVFTVPGVKLHPEPKHFAPAVLKMAEQLRKKH